jgi:hypothetical protein
LTTAAIARDYLNLCRNPLKNLPRWLEESRRGTGPINSIRSSGAYRHHAQSPSPRLASPGHGLRNDALPELQGRMDTHGQQRGQGYCLSARSGTGHDQYDQLRSLHASGRPGRGLNQKPPRRNACSPRGSLAAELASISSHYAARVAALRHSLPPEQAEVAVSALAIEETLLKKAAIDRWQLYFLNKKREPRAIPARPSRLHTRPDFPKHRYS